MKPILVIYATRTGQARRIAEHVADKLRQHAFASDTVDAAHIPADFTLDRYAGAIAVASVRLGKHEHEMIRFASTCWKELNRIPTAFVSVSLSQAGAEDRAASPEPRAAAAADVQRMIGAFLKKTSWHPTQIKAVAGALSYTQYDFLTKFVMKRIAAKAGHGEDTSRDYEFTDWKTLDDFVNEFTRAASFPMANEGVNLVS